MSTDEKTIENRLRRKLHAQGFFLTKSRANESLDNFGGYMICDGFSGGVVRGSRFELTLEDVEQFLSE